MKLPLHTQNATCWLSATSKIDSSQPVHPRRVNLGQVETRIVAGRNALTALSDSVRPLGVGSSWSTRSAECALEA